MSQKGSLIYTLYPPIQIIEFTFTHDMLVNQAMQTKEYKFINPLIDALKAQGWKDIPLIIISAGVIGAIHSKSIELL